MIDLSRSTMLGMLYLVGYKSLALEEVPLKRKNIRAIHQLVLDS
jgi:hypothetical protein